MDVSRQRGVGKERVEDQEPETGCGCLVGDGHGKDRRSVFYLLQIVADPFSKSFREKCEILLEVGAKLRGRRL